MGKQEDALPMRVRAMNQRGVVHLRYVPLLRVRIQQVLEQRLVQHEENALKKYADVDAKLASDPRLRALNP